LKQFWVPVSGPFWANYGGQVFDVFGSDFGVGCGPVSGASLVSTCRGWFWASVGRGPIAEQVSGSVLGPILGVNCGGLISVRIRWRCLVRRARILARPAIFSRGPSRLTLVRRSVSYLRGQASRGTGPLILNWARRGRAVARRGRRRHHHQFAWCYMRQRRPGVVVVTVAIVIALGSQQQS
jgi:hypothetical protein